MGMVLRSKNGLRTVECTGKGIACWILKERMDDYIVPRIAVRRLNVCLWRESRARILMVCVIVTGDVDP